MFWGQGCLAAADGDWLVVDRLPSVKRVPAQKLPSICTKAFETSFPKHLRGLGLTFLYPVIFQLNSDMSLKKEPELRRRTAPSGQEAGLMVAREGMFDRLCKQLGLP